MEERHNATEVQPRHSGVRTLVIVETRLYGEGLARVLARDPHIDLIGTSSRPPSLRALAAPEPAHRGARHYRPHERRSREAILEVALGEISPQRLVHAVRQLPAIRFDD